MSNLKCKLKVNTIGIISLFFCSEFEVGTEHNKACAHVCVRACLCYVRIRACIRAEGINGLW